MPVRARRTRAWALLFALAAACESPPTTSPKTETATAPDDQLGERLLDTVRALSDDALEGRRVGTPGNALARELIEADLAASGVQPLAGSYRHPFAVSADIDGVNLLAEIGGAELPDRYLLLSAHYDHLGVRKGEIYNGADDNASGVAVVLEIARRVAAVPLTHTLVVAFFDAEEGGLRGSRAFLAEPPIGLDRLRLVVNLDMVARTGNAGLFASGTHHSPALRPVLERATAGGPLELHFGHDRPEDGQENWTFQSDHAPFHVAGIPFVYFGVEDHADYHRPTDDWQHIDPAALAASAVAVERSLRALDAALAEGLDPRATPR